VQLGKEERAGKTIKTCPLLNLGVVSPAILIVATNQLLRHYPKS
tara:strand:+ start:772 stop:903 length:132 start_codon:yes stop_codon:yes gene_type:complete